MFPPTQMTSFFRDVLLCGRPCVIVSFVLMAFALTFVLFSSPTLPPASTTSAQHIVSQQIESHIAVTAPEEGFSRTHSHDFGTVAPHTVLHHTFTVRNDTAATWHITQIHTTCRCTVATPSATVVRPNDVLSLPVSFTIADDGGKTLRRSIRLTCGDSMFDQSFDVLATVKDPVTLQPPSPHVSLNEHEVTDMEILIENFSSTAWRELTIAPPNSTATPGLSVTDIRKVASPQQLPRSDARPREIWAATIRIDASRADKGLHPYILTVTSTPFSGPTVATPLTVSIEVRPDVRAIPGQLVIQRSDLQSTVKTIAIQFTGSALVPQPNDIRCSHDLPLQMTFNWKSSGAHTLYLTINIPVSHSAPEASRGILSIQLPPPHSSVLQIPVVVLPQSDKL